MNAININAMNIDCMKGHLLALLCLISSACPKVLMAHACENCKKCQEFHFFTFTETPKSETKFDISTKRFLAANFIFSLSPCHYKNGPYLIPAKNKHYFPKATLVITWPKRASIICGQIYLTNGVAERIVFTILIPIKAHVLTFMETNKVLLPSLCHCDLRVFVILYWLVFIHF